MSYECANLREEREAETLELVHGLIGQENKRQEEVESKFGNLIGKILLTPKPEAGVKGCGGGGKGRGGGSRNEIGGRQIFERGETEEGRDHSAKTVRLLGGELHKRRCSGRGESSTRFSLPKITFESPHEI